MKKLNVKILGFCIIVFAASCSTQNREIGFGGSWKMEKSKTSFLAKKENNTSNLNSTNQAPVAENSISEHQLSTENKIKSESNKSIQNTGINTVKVSKTLASNNVQSHASKPSLMNKVKATVKTKKAISTSGSGMDSRQIIAIILCLFLGSLGIHRFYMGHTWQGVVQLLTFGGFGIWVLIDLIRLILGDLTPNN